MPVKKIVTQYISLFVLQLLAAIICGPHSCEWGNTMYFFSGIACLATAFALYVMQTKCKLQKRVTMGLLMALMSVAFWCMGFILFDFRIICKLF
jgi:hypothetical protein